MVKNMFVLPSAKWGVYINAIYAMYRLLHILHIKLGSAKSPAASRASTAVRTPTGRAAAAAAAVIAAAVGLPAAARGSGPSRAEVDGEEHIGPAQPVALPRAHNAGVGTESSRARRRGAELGGGASRPSRRPARPRCADRPEPVCRLAGKKVLEHGADAIEAHRLSPASAAAGVSGAEHGVEEGRALLGREVGGGDGGLQDGGGSERGEGRGREAQEPAVVHPARGPHAHHVLSRRARQARTMFSVLSVTELRLLRGRH